MCCADLPKGVRFTVFCVDVNYFFSQIPQFIMDKAWSSARGGDCFIVVTQPRRLAAIGVAERVASERGEQVSA